MNFVSAIKWWLILVFGVFVIYLTQSRHSRIDRSIKERYPLVARQLDTLGALISNNELDLASQLISKLSGEKFRELKEDDNYVRWLFLQGKYHHRAREYPLAADFLQQAEAYVLDIDEPIEDSLYYVLERNFYLAGSHEQRRKFMRRYLDRTKDSKRCLGNQVRFRLRLGNLHYRNKDLDSTVIMIEDAQQWAREYRDTPLVIYTDFNRIVYDTSISEYQRLEMLENLPIELAEPVVQNMIYVKLHDIHLFKFSDFTNALSHAKRALGSSKLFQEHEHGRMRRIAENYVRISDLEFKLGNMSESLAYMDSAVVLQEYLTARWAPFLYQHKIEVYLADGRGTDEVVKAYQEAFDALTKRTVHSMKSRGDAQTRSMQREIDLAEDNAELFRMQRNVWGIVAGLLLILLAIMVYASRQRELKILVSSENAVLRAKIRVYMLKPKILINVIETLAHRLEKVNKDLAKSFRYISNSLQALASDSYVKLYDEVANAQNYLELRRASTSEETTLSANYQARFDVLVPPLSIGVVIDQIVESNLLQDPLEIHLDFEFAGDLLRCKFSTTNYSRKKGYLTPILDAYLEHNKSPAIISESGEVVVDIPYKEARSFLN